MRNKLVAVFVSAALAQAAAAQGTSSSASIDDLEQVVVTGTRVANRSALDTAVPVDVIPADALTNIGVTEINQALSVALPSFNFPRPGLSDGTDTVRPASLRGLAPDQTLVLVNSKRRHAAALVNVNSTVGRGSAAVDLNTIPAAAVRSIEVLRDGASAQYGSDAIAGVLNIRLREAREGGNVSVSYGTRKTDFKIGVNGTPGAGVSGSVPGVPANPNFTIPAEVERDLEDGEVLTASGWAGFGLGETGFLTLSFEYKDQARTERAGFDARQQYPALAGGVLDPREINANRFNAWWGEPELEQLTFFANAGADLSNGVKLYGWASYQDRSALSAGFFRRPVQTTQIDLAIYPNGFLPKISPDVADLSLGGGATWDAGEWTLDASLVHGSNEMDFTIKDTLNASIGPTSKTVLDSGGYKYSQTVVNFSGTRAVDVGSLASPLNVALGIEARSEKYSIRAGEPDSYRNANPASGKVSGAQVFPGFQPADAGSIDREAIGGYLDLEANLTDKLLASAAARFENYSDFGSNATGKLAARYDFTDDFALRASVQNGFRAPSLQQQRFSTTSTNFINNPPVPVEIKTFRVDAPAARALGAKDLEPEESVNFSLGAVLRLGVASLTIDAYRIDIDDRIVLSENLNAANVISFLASQGFTGIGGARFFINGADTKTEGVEVVLAYPYETDSLGKFDFTLTGSWNDTEIERLAVFTQNIPGTAPILYGREQSLILSEAQPENKFGANIIWTSGRYGATLRATRYGEALAPASGAAFTAAAAANDVLLQPRTLVDFEFRANLTDSLKAAFGAENMFDQYPTETPARLNATGTSPHSNYSPFGRSGRYIYGRLSYDF
jgi:iron complex outermembrane receptor protein